MYRYSKVRLLGSIWVSSITFQDQNGIRNGNSELSEALSMKKKLNIVNRKNYLEGWLLVKEHSRQEGRNQMFFHFCPNRLKTSFLFRTRWNRKPYESNWKYFNCYPKMSNIIRWYCKLYVFQYYLPESSLQVWLLTHF